MTLILYARRKGWPLDGVTIDLSYDRVHARDCEECEEDDDTMLDLIRRHIVVKGDLTEEQRQRLLIISRRCPVHRTLTEGPKILDEMEVAG